MHTDSNDGVAFTSVSSERDVESKKGKKETK
jgi:hypothetical protein